MSDTDCRLSEARVRRQVVGREHGFGVVCPPGLEDICLAEIKALGLTLADPAAVAGPVVECRGRLEDIYRANLVLRAASRVWVRLAEFRAGAREELFRKAAEVPWELWLPGGCVLRVDAHVEYSRISHEGMAADTVAEAVARRLGRAGLAAPRPWRAAADDEAESLSVADAGTAAPGAQRVLVRIADNHVSLSLDASGEHLHRRGWRSAQGAAPIRENLAAGLLAWAGWPEGRAALVDGMCGSGTFALEARAMATGWPASGSPTFAGRAYACADWPSWQEARFGWLRRQPAPGAAAAPPSIQACELDPAVLEAARGNAVRQAGTDAAAPAIAWNLGDFLEFAPPALPRGGRGLVALNPPYGLRLGDGGGSLHGRLCARLAAAWGGWDILVLGLPGADHGKLAARLRGTRAFRHGGLRLEAWLFGSES